MMYILTLAPETPTHPVIRFQGSSTGHVFESARLVNAITAVGAHFRHCVVMKDGIQISRACGI